MYELIDALGSEEGYTLKLASGYLNLPEKMIKKILSTKVPLNLDLLTSSPQANGFLNGGFVKGLVPWMYRSFTYNLLRIAALAGRADQIRVHEYTRGAWTFHSKGLWLYHSDNAVE